MSNEKTEIFFEKEELPKKESIDRVYSEFGGSETAPPPARKFIMSRDGLADLARKGIRRNNEKKRSQKMTKNPSETFKRKVGVLSEHVIEWCNYKASKGEWRHEYDLSKLEEEYFIPVLREVRTKMKDVIIIVHETQRKIVIEWGSGEV